MISRRSLLFLSFFFAACGGGVSGPSRVTIGPPLQAELRGAPVMRAAPTPAPRLVDATPGPGVIRGGAHDAAWFRSRVGAGEVPRPEDLTLEGSFAEHTAPLPPPLRDRALTLHPLLGLSIDPRTNAPAAVLHLGMNAAGSFDGLPRLPVNVAVVIDKSGSMQEEDKMAYVQRGLLLMLESLGPSDTLSIVTYDTTAQVALPPTRVQDRAAIQAVIRGIEPAGATHLQGGLRLGLELAASQLNPRGVNRVMLLSDGVPTVGASDVEALLQEAGPFLQRGIGLSTIGVGQDFHHGLMLELARAGGGSFYFLADAARVETVFRDELETMLTPFAEDLTLTFRLDERVRIKEAHGLPLERDEEGLPSLHLPTAYLSRRQGVMLLELDPDPLLRAPPDVPLGAITLEYRLTGTSRRERQTITLRLPPQPQAQGAFFEHAAARKSFDLLMTLYGLQDACAFYHRGDRQEAAALLDSVIAWLQDEVQQTRDDGLARELALAQRLRSNMR